MASWVELRVHGVSGTSPESLLHTDQIAEPVAGDRYVSFVRPAHPDQADEDSKVAGGKAPTHGRVLEGMSWGKLTSGSVMQATWLLLLPFALTNLAYWARPWRVPKGSERWSRLRFCSMLYRWIVRVLGLALTATIVFTASTAAIDLIGFQCGVQNPRGCAEANGWMGGLVDLSPGLLLAVAGLVPAAMIAGLWFVSHRTSLRYESFRTGSGATKRDGDPDLFSSSMWDGEVVVGRLRALHVSVGFAIAALILGYATKGLTSGGVRALMLTGMVLSGLIIIASVCLITAWARWSAAESDWGIRCRRFLPGAAVFALALVEIASAAASGTIIKPTQGHVPGILTTGHLIVLVQLVLLIVLFVVVSIARVNSNIELNLSATPLPEGHMPSTAKLTRAMGGYLCWLFAAAGTFFGFIYSSAVAFRVAALMTGSSKSTACSLGDAACVTVTPAPAFQIAGFTVGAFVVVMLAAGLVLGIGVFLTRVIKPVGGNSLTWVEEEYADDPLGINPTDLRVQRAVRARSFARSINVRWLGIFLSLGAAIGLVTATWGVYDGLHTHNLHKRLVDLGAGSSADNADPNSATSWTALQRLHDALVEHHLNTTASFLSKPQVIKAFDFLSAFGAWMTALIAVGMIGLGVLAWRNARARRLVGIAWDIVSFFPRAGHPLAPPCYAERAVPQLACRVAYLPGDDGKRDRPVVLSCHSQGTVIGVAALAQLAADDTDSSATPDRIALLTHGSPIPRLYAPIFPRLFASDQLAMLPVANGGHWTNLWRRTDPIGGSLQPVLHEASIVAETPVLGDLRLSDPKVLGMVPATSAYAPIYGHVNYYADPVYNTAITNLLESTNPELPGQRAQEPRVAVAASRPSV